MTSQPPTRDSPDAEALIGQALRAKVGAPKRGHAGELLTDRDETDGGARHFGRLTTAQTLLIAAIIGLVLGMAAAFVVVLA